MPRPKPRDFIAQMADQDEWVDDAACRDEEDPSIFDTVVLSSFTDITDATHAAMDTCADCPVMIRCLEHAIRHDIRDGVRGGMVYEARLAWAMEHRRDLIPAKVWARLLAVAA